LPAAVAAIPALAACAILGLRALDGCARVTLLLPFATALQAPFAVRVLAGAPVNPRYFQATVPAILVLLAIGATARAGWPRLARVAGVAVGLVLVLGTALHLANTGTSREAVAQHTQTLQPP